MAFLPRVVGVGAVSGSTSDIAPAFPLNRLTGPVGIATVAEHDLILIVCESSASLLAPSGYEEISEVAGTGHKLTLFWKRAGVSESVPTITDQGDHQVGQILLIRGAPRFGDPFNLTTTPATGTGTSVTLPGGTTTEDESLVLAIFGQASGAGPAFSAYANADLTRLTEVTDTGTAAGNGGGFAVLSARMETAGTFGNTTATAGISLDWSGFHLVFPPDPQPFPFYDTAGTLHESDGAGLSALLAYPANSIAGDFFIMVVGKYQQSDDSGVQGLWSTPSGWTDGIEILFPTGGINGLRKGSMKLFYKESAGGESGNVTVTHTGDSGTDTNTMGRIYRFCAVDPDDPWDDIQANSYGFGEATPNPLPAVSVVGFRRTLAEWSYLGGDQYQNPIGTASLFNGPDGYYKQLHDRTPQGEDGTLEFNIVPHVAVDGAVDTEVETRSVSPETMLANIQVALRSAGSGPTDFVPQFFRRR